MFMTRMALDMQREETQRIMVSPMALGEAVKEAADSPGKQTPWRVEQLQHRTYLLMVSLYRPSMHDLHERFGIAGAFPSWETRDYDDVLENAREGTRWHFSLRACPEKISCGAGDMHTRLHAMTLCTTPVQRAWLLGQSSDCGFRVDESAFEVVRSGWQVYPSGENDGTVILCQQVWYEGVLTVTDEALFYRALTEGIGTGRSLGMGLLTIVEPGGALHV